MKDSKSVNAALSGKRVALIGECLIELNGVPFGTLHQTFGGDSLNTALYLARLVHPMAEVLYATVVGKDPLSEGMVYRWRDCGISTQLVLRDPARLPGLYWIQVDSDGERSFQYWRGESAARYLLQHPQFDRVAAMLAEVHLIYVSGISLAILSPADRALLLDLLTDLAGRGIPIAFDSNYRPALWPSADVARAAISAMLPITHLMLATFDDERLLWGDRTLPETLDRLKDSRARHVVIKRGAKGCLARHGGSTIAVPALSVQDVVDTTAAGDAFNAGFVAGWLAGRDSEVCCHMGHALAASVIQHHGAIIPAAATPALAELLSQAGAGSMLI